MLKVPSQLTSLQFDLQKRRRKRKCINILLQIVIQISATTWQNGGGSYNDPNIKSALKKKKKRKVDNFEASILTKN